MPGWVLALLVLSVVGIGVQTLPVPVWLGRLNRRSDPRALPPTIPSVPAPYESLAVEVQRASEEVASAISRTEDLQAALPIASWVAWVSTDNWARALMEDAAERQTSARQAVASVDRAVADLGPLGVRFHEERDDGDNRPPQASKALALVTREDGSTVTESGSVQPTRASVKNQLEELRSVAAELCRIAALIVEVGDPYRQG